ncbi:hypothetical protein HM131_01900 [Halobacillus mangrovi]|uniref:HNH domain-containing protein n=2 Tax=Halobacillus mangrovi TaxID=402384 RepID=A0A1W6A0S3_9BACI|nr:hypothetical protein HM131_01900 [Halobacillus mangrovi]
MGISNEEKKILFSSISLSIISDNTELVMKINGIDIDPLETGSWPNEWNSLTLKLIRIPVIQEELTQNQLEELIIKVGGDLLSLTLSLLPLEVNKEDQSGRAEGELHRIESNKYERSPLNRKACIMKHGYKCKVCEFDFEKVYGNVGKGFIHVHHIIPISKIDTDYVINPSTDLVPVCPNCHAMLHRNDPPLSIEELKKIMNVHK